MSLRNIFRSPSTSTTQPSRERFDAFIPFVLEHEGGAYENDPDDPGGSTKWGIDIASHPFLSIIDLKNLTKDEATQIYFDSTYKGKRVCHESQRTDWEFVEAESKPAGLGESHFDASVNCGLGRATRFLRAADGDVVKYNDERDAFYHRLADARPRSRKYLKGWLNRTHDLRNYLHLA